MNFVGGDFFSTLNYSSCNEDWRTERKALSLSPTDRVLCICGSGDRPLNLLLDDPASILVIDKNPAQIHLLKLKVEAIKNLSYEEYVSFLGLKKNANRLFTFEFLSQFLDSDSKVFWKKNIDLIKKGVIYQGRWEKYFRKVSRMASLLRGEKIRRLFNQNSFDAQKRFVRYSWDSAFWRTTFKILLHPTVSRFFFGDPAFFEFVKIPFETGKFLYDRMLSSLQTYLAKENFMISLVFTGRLSKFDLPPYLDSSYFHAIKNRLDRLSFTCESLFDFFNNPKLEKFSAFSLSDVTSFFDQAGFERLLSGLINASADNAKFCIRQFLTSHFVPAKFEKIFVRDRVLELELEKQDRAFAYRFFVGKIHKA